MKTVHTESIITVLMGHITCTYTCIHDSNKDENCTYRKYYNGFNGILHVHIYVYTVLIRMQTYNRKYYNILYITVHVHIHVYSVSIRMKTYTIKYVYTVLYGELHVHIHVYSNNKDDNIQQKVL